MANIFGGDMKNVNQVPSASQRADALKQALDQKKLIPEGFLDDFNVMVTEDWRPENAANVIAKAWLDPDFKARLLKDGTAACAELGYSGVQGEYIHVLENTPLLQNVVVCTQCSCTAWPILGFPKEWYKSPEYRARLVRESRQVLTELGLSLPEEVEIRVTDTSAETRFLVLPERPDGTEGWDQERLAAIVTYETMVGIARVNL
ncbi:MAG: nitrile hydratase [Flavobacterium sp.]|jgi:nitrile hydratase